MQGLGLAALGLAAVAGVALLLFRESDKPLELRVPGTDHAPTAEGGAQANPVLAGKLIPGEGQASDLPGSWPAFRGAGRDGISTDAFPLFKTWPATGPREIWGVDVGEGYAGPAIFQGRVYLMDYDREKRQDALRCLSLADGREIWRFAYPVSVKRNHGMSRTVPSVSERVTIAMGPKCHVLAVETKTGALKWGLDLVKEYGVTVPQWYAGQCPLIDEDRVILGTGGPDTLLIALQAESGQVLWKTPNPRGWKMTHSSVVAAEFEGERIYIYCANNGVVGVSAKTGELLWETPEWKISIATVPSPVVLPEGRIFLSGGYNAGSLMLQMKKVADKFEVLPKYRLEPEVFGATQQSPILLQNHIFGVRPDGKFVCLDLEGKVVWTSESGQQYGLGPFMAADGVFFAVNDSGLLRLVAADVTRYRLLGQAQVLKGRESWAPLALAGGRLIVRDTTRMICLEVGGK
jgi:outer membrane protein assembly factor BamB